MLYEAFLAAKPLTRLAAVLFVVGKVCCFFTVLSALINQLLASIFLVIYITCVAAAIVLTLIDISKMKREEEEEKKKPSLEQVRRWAREYDLLGGVK